MKKIREMIFNLYNHYVTTFEQFSLLYSRDIFIFSLSFSLSIVFD